MTTGDMSEFLNEVIGMNGETYDEYCNRISPKEEFILWLDDEFHGKYEPMLYDVVSRRYTYISGLSEEAKRHYAVCYPNIFGKGCKYDLLDGYNADGFPGERK